MNQEKIGTRRLKKALIGLDWQVSRRIGRLMAAAGLAGKTKRKFKATTDSRHNLFITPNHLDRQFTVSYRNQIRLTSATSPLSIPWKAG